MNRRAREIYSSGINRNGAKAEGPCAVVALAHFLPDLPDELFDEIAVHGVNGTELIDVLNSGEAKRLGIRGFTFHNDGKGAENIRDLNEWSKRLSMSVALSKVDSPRVLLLKPEHVYAISPSNGYDRQVQVADVNFSQIPFQWTQDLARQMVEMELNFHRGFAFTVGFENNSGIPKKLAGLSQQLIDIISGRSE